MSATQRQYASEVLYMDYMSSEESDNEETEDPITGERERKKTDNKQTYQSLLENI